MDFWFNHFNVSARKGRLILPFLTGYERDVIRPSVLGNFRDLLGAVTESPAMLIYLDNWLSSDPDADMQSVRPQSTRPGIARPRPRQFGFFDPQASDPRTARGQPRGTPPIQPGWREGLNENYARELLELHTLGVDGGYMQQDVVEIARVLTGWTIAPLQTGGGFRFEPRLHRRGDKVVMGRRIEGREGADGATEGEQVLDLLARHPSTARFIATKLARRFVADEPPRSLIDRAAQRFLETDGDLREVTRTIITSPEFFAPEAYRAKVKTPLEFVVSTLRALDADVPQAAPVARLLNEMGMPLYACQPPTGYPDRADAWVNSGALLARMNAAVDIVGGRMRGVRVDLGNDARFDESAIHALVTKLVLNAASPTTRETLERSAGPDQFAVLAIGSPEFQRR